jgi:RHS repeat-associated protein
MTQNARQLPATVTNGSVLNYQYNYDANGNVEAIYDNARGSFYSRWMHYDGLDRLYEAGSASFGGDSWHRFTYDALDNVTSWKLEGVKDYATYYYNPTNNRLENILNSSGSSIVGIGYDPQGNVSNKNGAIYTFDYGNRLRTALGTELYRYDAFGRRVRTTSSSVNSYALYGQNGQILWERDERAGARLQYVYLNGTILATRRRSIASDAETIYFNHNDALGSLVALTDSTGTIAQRSDYDPFGGLTNRAANNRPAYTGHVMDTQTGLTYMQQRYYDPSVGRFLSVDPVTADGNTGGNFNRYWYANNNPYKFTDPDGRESACFSTGLGCGLRPYTAEDRQKVGVAMSGLAAMATLPFVAWEGAMAALANPGAVVSATNLVAEATGVGAAGVTANRLAGQAAERLAAKELVAEGNKLLGSQVAARTSEGLRFIDHLIETPAGKIVAVEVKSGNAVRSTAQLAKDAKMATEGAVITGKNAPADLRGQRVIIETIERRYQK